MSFGRYTNNDPGTALHEAIDLVNADGVPVVVSAGNFATAEISDMVPAGFDNVMAVASTTATWGWKDASSGCASWQQVAPDTASAFTTDGSIPSNGVAGITVSAPGAKQEDLIGQPSGNCALV
jgi:hypothetical protein